MSGLNRDVTVPEGVWPTMVTPFTETGEVDYVALGELVEWYVSRGVAGLFAVCQSSEMFHLTLEERVAIASQVAERVDGRCGVVASGHISDHRDEQLLEVAALGETGVDAVVLVSNRLAAEKEDEAAWIAGLNRFLEKLPSAIPLGMYECPYPYKRILTDNEFGALCDSGRFRFIKDTSCDLEALRSRAERAKGSGMKLFNANSTTLLRSFEMGYSGYSGVMANVHPELYVWLWNEFQAGAGDSGRLEELQEFLTISSLYELQAYPENAKYIISLDGVNIETHTRAHQGRDLSALHKEEGRQLKSYTNRVARSLGVAVS
jgi:4-hydroxy-tetrahydrodipicolinate synthase